MMRVLIFGCLFPLFASGIPHEKVAKIFSDIDYNKNDVISQNEVISFFELFKHDPHDELIQKSVFVSVWTKKYQDTPVVAEKLYDKLDANNDGILGNADVPVIFKMVDKNHNGIDWHEFETTFNAWYTDM